MEFFKRLGNKVKNTFTKKSDDNVIIEKNGAKIENSDNKKKNEKISIETIKNEFDALASQINDFLALFNKSQNDANAKLLGIIESLYEIHNNLIKKIKEFKIITRLQTQKIEDMTEEYKYTIFCNDSQLIKLNNRDIESACRTNETLKKILSNFEELKDIIAKLNVQQLKNINIKFESFFDKGKNKEIEDMRRNILNSLDNLCKITYGELIQFFVSIFLKKQEIKIKEAVEKAEKKLKECEQENSNSKMEGNNYIAGNIDMFLSKFNQVFDIKAYDSFHSIYLSIIQNIKNHNKEFCIDKDYKVYCKHIKPTQNFQEIKWEIEFDERGDLLEKSDKQFLKIYQWLENYASITVKDGEKIKDELYKLLKFSPEEIKYYFRNCYLTLKEEKEKMKDPRYREQKVKEEKERMEKLKKEQKEKEKKEKERTEKLKKEQKEKEKKEKERKEKELETRKRDICTLTTNFLVNAKEKISNLAVRYEVFTAQNIINFFNEYYKYYSDLYDIYECLPTKKWFNKGLDAKIEYTNIGADLTSCNCQIPLIKQTINYISNNIPKFQEIQQWFDKICNKKDNNYRGAPQDIFNNNFINPYLFILKTIKLPTNKDVEIIKKQQFSNIKWD